MAGALSLSGFLKGFVVAWAAGRLVDAGLTWAIISRGLGYERNPVAAWFIREFGLDLGLALFTAMGIGLGVLLAIVVTRFLLCSWCRTKFDEAMFRALGVEGVARVILAAALGVSLVPVVINGLCLYALLQGAR